MSKYNDLVNIIEHLRKEAPLDHKRYHPKEGDVDGYRKALSRTYLHLFLTLIPQHFDLTLFISS